MAVTDHPPAIIEILTDYGGRIGERQAVMEYIRRSGVQVRITGVCTSMCNWFLSLPKDQVCVSPQAWFGTHNIGEINMVWSRGSEVIAQRGIRSCR